MNSVHQRSRHKWSRVLLGLAVLATCIRIWFGPPALIDSAQAQIPDSGKQRIQLLEEARRTNRILTEIKQILEGRTLNVRVVGADNKSDAPAGSGKTGG